MADTDGDGVINFTEYSFFMTLLSCTPRQFEISFKMFDIDGNGSVSLEEFLTILSANGADKVIISIFGIYIELVNYQQYIYI